MTHPDAFTNEGAIGNYRGSYRRKRQERQMRQCVSHLRLWAALADANEEAARRYSKLREEPMKLKAVENGGDWIVVDEDELPGGDWNYYGMVAFGFRNRADAHTFIQIRELASKVGASPASG
jgi:hypothetical protein